jgi:hypothetical protein
VASNDRVNNDEDSSTYSNNLIKAVLPLIVDVWSQMIIFIKILFTYILQEGTKTIVSKMVFILYIIDMTYVTE